MAMEDNTHFRTTDTALAAYLKSSGYEVLEIDASGHRAIFLFENSDGLEEYVKNFELMKGSAEPIILFFHAYKALIQKIHIQRRIQE